MSRRRIHIFLLTLIALFSCTDLYEKTGDVLIGTAVESEEVRSQAAVLSWDDSRETSMAQPGEVVSIPACLPTPPAPHSVAVAKHLRTGKTLLRMPSAIVAERHARRHHSRCSSQRQAPPLSRPVRQTIMCLPCGACCVRFFPFSCMPYCLPARHPSGRVPWHAQNPQITVL